MLEVDTCAQPSVLYLQRIALKSFFCMTRSYMSEHFDAAPWIGSIMQLLKHGVHVAELRSAESSSKGADGDASMGADDDIEDDSGDNAVWRLQKRGVQALLNFQSRHRTYAAYKSIEKEGLALAQRAVKVRKEKIACSYAGCERHLTRGCSRYTAYQPGGVL